MKAIKKNFENLEAVAKRIERVPLVTGKFHVTKKLPDINLIRLDSERDDIGYVVLRHIPSNYRYTVSFVNHKVELLIWY